MNMKTQGIQAKIIAWVLSVGAGLSFCCNHIEIPNKIGRIPNEMIAKIEPGVVGFAQVVAQIGSKLWMDLVRINL